MLYALIEQFFLKKGNKMEFNQKSTSTWYDKYRQSTKQLTTTTTVSLSFNVSPVLF